MCNFVSLFSLQDLFDDEGFSLSDINETVVGTKAHMHIDDMYFLDFEEDCLNKCENECGRGSVSLSMDEEVDLHRAKVRMTTKSYWLTWYNNNYVYKTTY